MDGAYKRDGCDVGAGEGAGSSCSVVTPLLDRIVSRPAALLVPPTAAACWLAPTPLIKSRLGANK